jgi:hypothetical protein
MRVWFVFTPVIVAVALAFASGVALAEDACTLKQVGHVPVTFDAKTGEPLVTITAGNQSLTLVVDTEAPFSAITPEAAQRLNAKLKSMKDVELGLKIGNKEVTSHAIVKSLAIDRAQITDTDFPVIPPASSPRTNDGDLGMDLLRNFDIEFDFLNGYMNFFAHFDCDRSPVYWTDNYGDIDLVTNPLNYIVFRTVLNGSEVPTILGTAYRLTAMPRKIASDRFNIRPNVPAVACARDAQSGDKFAMLEVGGLSIRNPEINSDCNNPLCPTAETLVPQLGIGINHLKKLRIFLAWKKGKIYFTPGTAAS